MERGSAGVRRAVPGVDRVALRHAAEHSWPSPRGSGRHAPERSWTRALRVPGREHVTRDHPADVIGCELEDQSPSADVDRVPPRPTAPGARPAAANARRRVRQPPDQQRLPRRVPAGHERERALEPRERSAVTPPRRRRGRSPDPDGEAPGGRVGLGRGPAPRAGAATSRARIGDDEPVERRRDAHGIDRARLSSAAPRARRRDTVDSSSVQRPVGSEPADHRARCARARRSRRASSSNPASSPAPRWRSRPRQRTAAAPGTAGPSPDSVRQCRAPAPEPHAIGAESGAGRAARPFGAASLRARARRRALAAARTAPPPPPVARIPAAPPGPRAAPAASASTADRSEPPAPPGAGPAPRRPRRSRRGTTGPSARASDPSPKPSQHGASGRGQWPSPARSPVHHATGGGHEPVAQVAHGLAARR